MAREIKNNLAKEEVVVDAAGQPLGRLAVQVAHVLRGKYKIDYRPNIDYPIYVKITNAKQVVFTGDKLKQRMVNKSTGYVGNMKQYKLSQIWERNPLRIIQLAVAGMLPKNKTRDHRLKRISLTV